jgi:hypothetical protein
MISRQYPDIGDATPCEPAGVYRDAFLCASAHLGISSSDAAALVEALSERHFDECAWAELAPAIKVLQIVVDEILATRSVRGSACE